MTLNLLSTIKDTHRLRFRIRLKLRVRLKLRLRLRLKERRLACRARLGACRANRGQFYRTTIIYDSALQAPIGILVRHRWSVKS